MCSAQLMIVEDEGLIAESMRRTLEQEGYRVAATTGNGQEAVQLARETNLDLIIMDQRLNGDMGGVEAAGQIQQTEDLSVVFMTAFNLDKLREQADHVDYEDVLSKPMRDEQLISTIEEVLS